MVMPNFASGSWNGAKLSRKMSVRLRTVFRHSGKPVPLQIISMRCYAFGKRGQRPNRWGIDFQINGARWKAHPLQRDAHGPLEVLLGIWTPSPPSDSPIVLYTYR